MGNECCSTYCPCMFGETEEEHMQLRDHRVDPEGRSASNYVMDEEELRLQKLRIDMIEKAKYAPMWKNIVNNSMVGTGIVQGAAITSQDGQMLAASETFTVSKPEILLLSRAIHHNPGDLAITNIKIGDETFIYKRSELGSSVYGRRETGDGGCVVCATKRCLMFAVYDEAPDAAENLVEELAEYLRERGM